MIDLSEPPYSIVPDWTGSDSLATDWSTALEDAIDFANTKSSALPIDNGGTQGNHLVLPSGAGIMISRPLPPLSNGVVLDGGSMRGTLLVTKSTFDPTRSPVVLGDQALYDGQRVASFGAAIRNLTIRDKNPDVAYGVPVIFTDNVQDTRDMIASVQLYTTRTMGVKAITGIGGASFVHMANVLTTTYGANRIGTMIDYGEGTQVLIDMAEPAASKTNGVVDPGTMGLFVKGGRVTVRGFHVEDCERGIYVALKSSAPHSKFRLVGATGGAQVTAVVTIDGSSPVNNGRIKLEDVHRNGATYTVEDGRSGKSPVTADIEEPMVF